MPSGVERGPAAAVTSSPWSEPCHETQPPRFPIAFRFAAVEFSLYHDEAQTAEAVIIEFDEAGLDEIDGILIPVVHLGDTPLAHVARALGQMRRE